MPMAKPSPAFGATRPANEVAFGIYGSDDRVALSL
jgi:hypothetical protein